LNRILEEKSKRHAERIDELSRQLREQDRARIASYNLGKSKPTDEALKEDITNLAKGTVNLFKKVVSGKAGMFDYLKLGIGLSITGLFREQIVIVLKGMLSILQLCMFPLIDLINWITYSVNEIKEIKESEQIYKIKRKNKSNSSWGRYIKGKYSGVKVLLDYQISLMII
jgi:hypothetical protein